jgi:hypothetical protein
MHDYKSLLCLGDYKEDTYYIVLSTGDLKKSVTHKASKSKIFLSSIIGYHVLGFALFKSIESNEVLSIYLLLVSFILSIIAAIVYNIRLYLNTEFEKVEFTRAEFNGFKKQVKKHNKTIVLFTLLFIVMFSFSMFLYLSRPSIFLLLVMNYVVCFSYLFYTNGFFTKRFHFEEYINKNFLKGG